MGLDKIDLMIFEGVKNSLYRLIPNVFTGELAMFNSYLKGLIIICVIGEIIVLIVKRNYAIKQTKLFGLRRGN